MSEHQQRVKAATTATTLGDLRALVSDLQTGNAPVQLPTLKKPRLNVSSARGGWGIRAAVAGVLVLLGIGIGWGLYGNTPSPMRKRFGDTTGYRLVIYPDYASLDRADPNDDRRALNYTYRGGWGDPGASPKSSDATLVDLATFDAKAVVGVLRGAPETLNIKPPDVTSTYLIIEPTRDPTAPGTLSISIYVSSDFGSGYIQLGPDGTVKQVNYP
jgi:hypothetical protein